MVFRFLECVRERSGADTLTGHEPGWVIALGGESTRTDISIYKWLELFVRYTVILKPWLRAVVGCCGDDSEDHHVA